MTGCVAALKFEQNSWDFTARLIAKRVPMLAKKHPIRGMVLALLTASLWTTAAFADEEGYTENWLGDIRVEFSSPDRPEAIGLPGEPAGPALSERLRAGWVENSSKICELLRRGFEESGGVREWQRCELATSGELRGRAPALFPNRLDLKYVVPGNLVQFKAPTPSVLGEWADPIIEAKFSAVIRLTLLFDTRLDLVQPDANSPIRLLSGHTGFAGVQLRSSWDSIPVAANEIAPSLREGEIKLSGRIENLLPETFPLGAMNGAIHAGANALKAALEAQGSLIPYLSLRTLLAGNDFVMLFSKGARPTVPLSMCSCTSACGQRITCTCGGAGVLQDDERVLLQRLKAGVWTASGVSDPGSWSVNGNPLGSANGEELVVRLCTVNQWGRTCGDELSFVYQSMGECTAHDPTPTNLCPNNQRPCPGHGCISSSMTCTPVM